MKLFIEAEWRIYVSENKAIIGADNNLLPVWHQAIIWTNIGLLSTEHLGTNFYGIGIKTQQFSFKNMNLKMCAEWRPFCLSLIVLNQIK